MFLWGAMWTLAAVGFAAIVTTLLLVSVYAYDAGAFWIWAVLLGLMGLLALLFVANRRDKPPS